MIRYIVVEHNHYDSTEPVREKMTGFCYVDATDDDPVPSYASRAAARAAAARLCAEDDHSSSYVWAIDVPLYPGSGE